MPGLGRAVTDTCIGEKEKCEAADTCIGEKEKCEAGGGCIMPKTLDPSCACYKCYRRVGQK